MKNLKLVMLLGIFIFLTSIALAQTSRPPLVFNQPSKTSQWSAWNLTDRIDDAQQMLNGAPKLNFIEKAVKYRNKKGKLISATDGFEKREIALAILDNKTGNIYIRRYWLNEEEIKTAARLRKLYLPGVNLPNFASSDGYGDFKVTAKWWNDHNSDLAVADSAGNSGYIVVANRFLVENKFLAYPDDRTGAKYSDIVYTPYSAAIHTPELVAKGKSFLDSRVSEAFRELSALGVRSRSHTDRLAVDMMSESFVKNIFTTEQTDPKLIFLSDDGGKTLAERALIRLGANEEKAYRYTFSKTGALGLGQIMPGTYNSIVKSYPSAKLIKDTNIGRVDIKNSIKASILVLDDHYKVVVDRANKAGNISALNSKLSHEIEEIRAAIYNGGPGKYQPLTATISTKVRETVDFVRKFKMIRALKLYR